MDKVLIRSVKQPQKTKLVKPVFADILVGLKVYERVDLTAEEKPTRRRYSRRDMTAEE